MSYQFSKTEIRECTVFETKQTIKAQHFNENEPHEAFLIVFRTVTGFRDSRETKIDSKPLLHKASSSEFKNTVTLAAPRPETPQQSHPLSDPVVNSPPSSPIISSTRIITPKIEKKTSINVPVTVTTTTHKVHLFGYYVEPVPSDSNVTQVTIVSQFSQELQRLDVNFQTCRKLKMVIEEFAAAQNQSMNSPTLSAPAFALPDLRRRRVPSNNVSVSGSLTEEQASQETAKRIMQLRNFVGSAAKSSIGNAASYLMKNRRIQTWLTPRESPSLMVTGSPPQSMNQNIRRRPSMSSVGSRSGSPFGFSGPDILYNEQDGVETELMVFGSHNDSGNLTDEESDEVTDNLSPTKIESNGHDEYPIFEQELPSPTLHSELSQSVTKIMPLITKDVNNFSVGSLNADTVVSPIEITDFDSQFKTPFDVEPFVDHWVGGRESIRVEVPFVNDPKFPLSQIVWEFHTRMESPIQFAILFQSNETNDDSYVGTGILGLLENGQLPGEKTVVPLVSTNAYSRSAKGAIPINGFPSGTFIFTWDNSQRPAPKPIAYKFIIHPLAIDMVPSSFHGEFAELVASSVASNPLFRRPPILIGNAMEVILPRRFIFKMPIIFDESVINAKRFKKTQGGRGSEDFQARLVWDFSTGGFDVAFGIVFTPFPEPGKSDIEEYAESFTTAEISQAAEVSDDQLTFDTELYGSDALATTGWSTDERSENELSELTDPNVDAIEEKANKYISPLTPPIAIPPRPSWFPEIDIETITTKNSVPLSKEISPGSLESPKHRSRYSNELLLQTSENLSIPEKPPRSLENHLIPEKPSRFIEELPIKPPRLSKILAVPIDTSEQVLRQKTSIGSRLAVAVGREDITGVSPTLTTPPTRLTRPSGLTTQPLPDEVIIPVMKCNSHRTTISGKLDLLRFGVYSFIWDNTVSLVSSRNVSFRVAMIIESDEVGTV
ncbi:hypothetical protein HK096_005193 [Nowakowskiella sp. JEL0078]|nr:hypothetical protein HK096_005193 [Nowakowskiella sp. JEL0078]